MGIDHDVRLSSARCPSQSIWRRCHIRQAVRRGKKQFLVTHLLHQRKGRPETTVSCPNPDCHTVYSSSGSNEMSNTEDSTFSWNVQREREFLIRLIKFRHDYGGIRPTPLFYEKWATELRALFETSTLTAQKLVEKRNRMRRDFVGYKMMMKTTGLGFNPETGNATCDNAVWKEFVKKYKVSASMHYLGLPNKDLYFTLFEQDVAVGDYVISSASHHAETTQGLGDDMLIGTDVPIENDEESPYVNNQNIGNTSCAPECDAGTSRRPRSQRKRRQNTQNEFVASAIWELADSIRSSSNKSARTEDKEDLMVTCMHVAQRLGITDMQKYQLMVYLKNPEFVPPFAKFDNDGSRWATIWAAIDSVPPPTPPPSLDP